MSRFGHAVGVPGECVISSRASTGGIAIAPLLHMPSDTALVGAEVEHFTICGRNRPKRA